MKWALPSGYYRGLTSACLLLAMLGTYASVARAQALPSGRARPGLNLYETFAGSRSSSGSVLNISNTVGYDFTRRLGMDITVPFYFVLPPTKTNGFAGAASGLGNLSVDGRLSLELLLVDYHPTLSISFPTGNMTKGFSTGTVTYDFDNRFDHQMGIFNPFFDVDVGNSLSNGSSTIRRGVQRPYLTLGKVANFTVGSEIELTDRLTFSADVYKTVPWGPQTVFSRIVLPGMTGKGGKHNRNFEIVQKQVGGADIVDDHGFDASVGFNLTASIDLSLALNRSVRYALNTVSFSVGFNISQMLSSRHD